MAIFLTSIVVHLPSTRILQHCVVANGETHRWTAILQVLDDGIDGISPEDLLVSSQTQVVMEGMIPGSHQRLEIFTLHDLCKEALD